MIRLGLSLAAVTSVLLLGACKKSSPPQQGPLPVNVVTVIEKEVNEWDEFTGRLEAVESVDIRPRVSGLYYRDPFRSRRHHQEGRSALRDRSASLSGGLRSSRRRIRAHASATQIAQIELDRAKDLRTKNTISASEFDQKAATYQGSAAAAAAAEAAKNSAALNLEFTQIKSPIDGRVSDARITLGNLVQPGAGPESVLTTVVSVDPIYAKVDADENAVLEVRKAQ